MSLPAPEHYVGRPCANGHPGKRYKSSRRCVECCKLTKDTRYQKNPEKEKLRGREIARRKLPKPTRPCPAVCELCGAPPGKRCLHLDHDHRTKQFRGWLCQNCNLSLGKFGDDTDGLRAAYLYLLRAKGALLPDDADARKQVPLYSGLLAYFPSALAEVAKVSYKGSAQHHPGEPLHWDRNKSTDHADALMRHFSEKGQVDPVDGMRHTAKMAWRSLAMLQLELEGK